jgi:hypothetical protein
MFRILGCQAQRSPFIGITNFCVADPAADLDPTLNFDENLVSDSRFFLPLRPLSSIADPIRSPPSFFDTETDPTFSFDVDPDHAHHQRLQSREL